MHRGVTFRLEPTPQQTAQFERWAGVCRLVWNLALEQKQAAWGLGRQRVSWAAQCAELKDLRAAFPFIAKAPATALHNVVRDLDAAYRNWWAGHASAPKWKSAKRSVPRVRLHCQNVLSVTDRHIAFTKAGRVRARISRELPGRIIAATLVRRGRHWYVSLTCEVPDPAPVNHAGGSVGIDVGIANTVTLDTGEKMQMPVPDAVEWRKLARLQRRMARRRRGSRGYRIAARAVAAWYERHANSRGDFLAKTANDLTKRFAVVALEDLAIEHMTRRRVGRGHAAKAGLNRELLQRAFGDLRRRLEYKAKETGSRVIAIDPRHTSQTCSCCGHVARENRESQAVFRCVVCQYEDHADVNAAINIRRAGQAQTYAEGAGGLEGPALNSEPYTTSMEASYVR